MIHTGQVYELNEVLSGRNILADIFYPFQSLLSRNLPRIENGEKLQKAR